MSKRSQSLIVLAVALGAFAITPSHAQTTYTVDGVAGQGTGWGGSGIVTWNGSSQVTLTSSSTFVADDKLVITAQSKMRGADFDGWNLTNLTIRCNIGRSLEDAVFIGAAFGNTAITNVSDQKVFDGTDAGNTAFGGDLTGLTIHANKDFFRNGHNALDGSSFSGAVININGSAAFGRTGGSPACSFSGATVNMNAAQAFEVQDIDGYDFSAANLTINKGGIWRASTGLLGTDWTGSTIDAAGGGLFNAFNSAAIFNGQTFDFDGATLSSDIFNGLSQDELNNGGFTLDFRGANVGGLTSSPDVDTLTNLAVLYDSATTFGSFTEQNAIDANWTWAEPTRGTVIAIR